MAVYAITGKLGSGKGKAGIQRLREYIRKGKRVATNCDVFLEHIGDQRSKATVIRVPDKPTPTDLYMIGSGNAYIQFEPNIQVGSDGRIVGLPPLESPRMLPGFDESHNGALVLDECASWLNTRDFQSKGRAELLEWAIHARKYGWDIFFIMQNISQIDKQIRDALFEYVVRLNRLDRMRVPLLSPMIKGITAGAVSGAMPRIHVAVVRLGSNPDGLIADRWIFQGDDLHQAYNTTQVFSDTYPHGAHTLLSHWHLSCNVALPPGFVGPVRPGRQEYELLRPRAQPLKPPHKHMTKFLVIAMLFGALGGAAAGRFFHFGFPAPVVTSAVAAADRKFSENLSIKGVVRNGATLMLMMSDGRVVTEPKSFVDHGGAWEAELSSGVWVKGGER